MRILVISGSPRGITGDGKERQFTDIPRPGNVIEPVLKDSACMLLANAFIEGAKSAGHECGLHSLHTLRNISPCRACYGCLGTGKCVQRDDMQVLYPEFDRADAVLFVSPLYYATLPAQMLAVVNRLYPYWIDGIRYPKLQGVGVIGTCADWGQSWDLFDRTWHSIFGEIGWKEFGIIHAPRFMEHIEEQLNMAKEFGKNFGVGK